ncbi:EamA family transporter [Pseudolysinimonas yzui]|uniref:Membrane protein n=1 Tax=Pseudolysinimonas yzui TaxID=2708254 RepID=A0A8J3GMK3_9MICO|nr:DMT family transporter [Pseudolysinimonas yzui]GHF04368.1 membrane protein [Pseudolysinimonas yzui]
MTSTRVSTGLVIGVLASVAFGTSGALAKPLMEAGWSPAAAVTVRAGLAGILLVPFALAALRGKWDAVWRARWRILGMALIGVAGTQLVYFAAIQRIPVSSGLLIEYLAPLLLVAGVAVATRRMPRPIVLIGSVVAIAGLVLIIGPVGGGDALGYLLAGVAAVGCALYYVIAARPAHGLPPVAFAAFGLLLGSLSLGIVGLAGLVPFEIVLTEVSALGGVVPWWMPLSILAATTAIGYAFSITASQRLGSRLMSFVGMLEVVFASLFAWLLLGEGLGVFQLLGGVLILAGIACVRSEKQPDPTLGNERLHPRDVDEPPSDRELGTATEPVATR